MRGDEIFKMKKQLHTLEAISTLDGRYREKVEELSYYASEKALIHARIEVEVLFLLHLSKEGIIRKISQEEEGELRRIIEDFSLDDAQSVKEIEKTTAHDVKAVEYYIREKIKTGSLSDITEKIHLFLTSEDVNNISQRILLRRSLLHVIIPELNKLLSQFSEQISLYHDTSMLGRTHGQAAVPTTVGKEFSVFAKRLLLEVKKLNAITLTAKLNGAMGNYNSFHAAYPQKSYSEWKKFSEEFISQFGFVLNPVTTQINTYEDIIETLQIVLRINGILIDFSADIWRYISDGWFIQKKIEGEVGSSTMPQKVNPIDFENAEGNFFLANDILKGLSERLSVSRLQRDLRDSTQIRNMGQFLGYTLLGLKSLGKGVSKIVISKDTIYDALNKDWSILSEAVQVYLRAHEKTADPYAVLKKATRGTRMGEEEWKKLIVSLDVSSKTKEDLLKLTPENYTGFASEIAQEVLEDIKKWVR